MLVLADYTVSKTVHDGPFHAILLGTRNKDQLEVILKTPHSDHSSLKDIAKLRHEYEVLKLLDDLPGVAHAYDFQHQQKPILILESILGQSLQSYLYTIQKLPLESFFAIALQLVDIIGALHLKQIIHKDIKPANIVIDPSTLAVKLIDFSLSSLLHEEQNENLSPSALEGTLAYISPEQTGRLNCHIDYRTDFYSLGITFYVMLTGHLPFQAEEPIEMVYSHLAKIADPVHQINPNIPKAISEIIAKLMAKSPEDRYASAAGLKADLKECAFQWEKNQRIDSFPLAQQDIHDHLRISQKLYGREEQISQLMSAFERVSQGSSELLLISGYSGVGKTALVKEINKPIVQHRGYFVTGKFVQFQQATAYSAFTEAFQELIRRLLAGSQARLEQIGQNLKAALGNNAQVIIDLIPTLELIIGPQAPVPVLDFKGTQTRFILSLQNFVRALTAPEHPLVLFIDDWQWSDSASRQLLQMLFEDQELKYLLIIGAYRDNEVTADHPFKHVLESLQKMKSNITEVGLLPLKKMDIQQLVMDSLNCDLMNAMSLSELLLEKTQGNPFFINEFLKTLYQNGLLKFSYESGEWIWDLKQIREQNYTDNVVDFLVARIRRLSAEAQTILKVAACMGNVFDIQLLSRVIQQSLPNISKSLHEIMQANLINAVNDNYHLLDGIIAENESDLMLSEKISFRFMHDRIRQAAYSLTDLEDKKMIHLKIGRLLYKDLANLNQGDLLITVVNHFNIGHDLIEDPFERRQLAELNFKAGQQTKNTNAYDISVQYFQQGVSYLSLNSWQEEYNLTFELNHGLLDSTYLNGDFIKAEEIFRFLLDKSATAMDKVETYLSIAELYINKSKYTEAIQVVLQALNILDNKLPFDPSRIDIIYEIIKVKWLLRNKTTKQLFDAKEITDLRILTILKALDMLWSPTSWANRPLFALIVLRRMALTIRYGNSLYAAGGYLGYGLLLAKHHKDDQAYEFGKLSIDLLDKYNIKALKAKYYPHYAINIHYLRNPVKDCIRFSSEGYVYAMESGNLAEAGYNVHILEATLFCSGEFLVNVLSAANKAVFVSKKIKDVDALICATVVQHLHSSLLNEEENQDWNFEEKNEQELNKYIVENKLIRSQVVYNARRACYYYLMGQYSKVIPHQQAYAQFSENSPTLFYTIFQSFYYALTLTAIYPELSKQERYSCIKEINYFLSILKKQANSSPINFTNKYFLARAELARITQNNSLALNYYIQAINVAKEQGFIHEEAIAHELLGKFYMTLDDIVSAQSHLQAAYHRFSLWGSKAKMKQMERIYPTLIMKESGSASPANQMTLDGSSGKFSNKDLDIASLLKASQAISSEIQLENLLKKLLYTVIENAGAQRGLVLARQGTNWVVEAEGTGDTQDVDLEHAEMVTNRKDLPLTLIDYVQRTQQALILPDAGNSEYTETDPFLKQYKPKSIFIMPISYKGHVNNLLYLENNLTTNSFTPAHLLPLKMLSEQAAISLENARLFSISSKFIPNELLNQLNKRDLTEVRLGDHISRDMTVLFCDIRDFTSRSEKLSASEVYQFINDFLGAMEPVIGRHHGFIDKFIGDAIMALFQNPDAAVAAAIEMLHQLPLLNEKLRKQNREPIRIGIGINTGDLMMGIVGGKNRFEGTVVGDSVNSASRIETLTKTYGVSLLISEATRSQLVSFKDHTLRLIDKVQVKGKRKFIDIWEVCDCDELNLLKAKNETLDLFNLAISEYGKKRYESALDLFKQCMKIVAEDSVVNFYIEKCKEEISHFNSTNKP